MGEVEKSDFLTCFPSSSFEEFKRFSSSYLAPFPVTIFKAIAFIPYLTKNYSLFLRKSGRLTGPL